MTTDLAVGVISLLYQGIELLVGAPQWPDFMLDQKIEHGGEQKNGERQRGEKRQLIRMQPDARLKITQPHVTRQVAIGE